MSMRTDAIISLNSKGWVSVTLSIYNWIYLTHSPRRREHHLRGGLRGSATREGEGGPAQDCPVPRAGGGLRHAHDRDSTK